MPIDFTQEKKKQKYLLIIVGVIVVITIVVLWFGVFKKPSDVPIIIPVSFVREIKIDFDVLENPLLKVFQQFEKVAPFDGIKGRSNPFLPY